MPTDGVIEGILLSSKHYRNVSSRTRRRIRVDGIARMQKGRTVGVCEVLPDSDALRSIADSASKCGLTLAMTHAKHVMFHAWQFLTRPVCKVNTYFIRTRGPMLGCLHFLSATLFSSRSSGLEQAMHQSCELVRCDSGDDSWFDLF